MSDGSRSAHTRSIAVWPLPLAARKLSRLAQLTEDDLKLLGGLKTRTLASGQFLSAEQASEQAGIIISGWCARVPSTDESTLQIMSLMLPGDGFGFACRPWAGDNLPVRVLTECVLADAASVRHAIRVRAPTHARLSEACQRAEWLDQSYLLNHVTRLGRRNLYGRVAHFLIEAHARLLDVGLVKSGSFDLPLTQRVVAEMLGLSGVHLNRITRAMKRDHLVEFPRGFVHIPDAEKLAGVAEFAPMLMPFGARPIAAT